MLSFYQKRKLNIGEYFKIVNLLTIYLQSINNLETILNFYGRIKSNKPCSTWCRRKNSN